MGALDALSHYSLVTMQGGGRFVFHTHFRAENQSISVKHLAQGYAEWPYPGLPDTKALILSILLWGILQEAEGKKERPEGVREATDNFGLDPLVFSRSYGSFPASMSSIVYVWTPGYISIGLALSACSTS